jgi:hypothetical protein
MYIRMISVFAFQSFWMRTWRCIGTGIIHLSCPHYLMKLIQPSPFWILVELFSNILLSIQNIFGPLDTKRTTFRFSSSFTSLYIYFLHFPHIQCTQQQTYQIWNEIFLFDCD